MILDYLRLRRLGIKHDVAADIANLDSLTSNLKAGATIVLALLGLLVVHGWMLERDMTDAQEQAQQSSAEAQRAWATVANILNGHPVKVDERTALFVEVHEERDLCSAC